MADANVAALSEATRAKLSALISKPKLTDKLLAKPPFRFLHDIISELISVTGFAQGLFSAQELDAASLNESKDLKVAFLVKIIAHVSDVSGIKLACKPIKIVAGAEPENTNLFLQALADAAAKADPSKAGSASSPQPASEGGDPALASAPSKPSKKKKASAPSDAPAEEGDEKKPKRSKSKSRAAAEDAAAAPEAKKKRSKSSSRKSADKDAEPDQAAAADSAGDGGEKKRSRSKSKGRSSSKSRGEGKDKAKTKEKKSEGSSKKKSKEGGEGDASGKSGKSKKSSKQSGDAAGSKEAPAADDADDAGGGGKKKKKRSSSSSSAHTGTELSKPTPAAASSSSSSVAQALADSDWKGDTADGGGSNRNGDAASGGGALERVSSSGNVAPPNIRQTTSPASSPRSREAALEQARAPRPMTAGRAPPRLQDNVRVVEKVARASTDHFAVAPVAPPQVITETEGNLDDSEEEVIVQSSSSGLSSLLDGVSGSDQHGALVANLLKADMSIAGSQKPGGNAATDRTSAAATASTLNKAQLERDVAALQNGVQTLCKNSNPLAKAMDYVQEDVENMSKEQLMWKMENSQHLSSLEEEERAIEQGLQGQYAKLAELEQAIKDEQDRINTLKSNIYANDASLQKMLRMVVQS